MKSPAGPPKTTFFVNERRQAGFACSGRFATGYKSCLWRNWIFFVTPVRGTNDICYSLPYAGDIDLFVNLSTKSSDQKLPPLISSFIPLISLDLLTVRLPKHPNWNA